MVSGPVRAQESSDSRLEQLEGIVVTANRLPSFLGESVRIVTVLDSLAISTIPASNINDLLKFAVGVDVRQRGPEGVQTDISLRGGTCEQIAVLLDGICISDPQTGHNSADFPVPVSEIERIEILEGPAARTYGTSSLLGAINIPEIRKLLSVPEEDQIRLVIALGKPAHTSMVVPLGEDGKTDYYLDEERNYYVPKRAFEDVVTFA
jgi:outer membrane cobalamin receptor